VEAIVELVARLFLALLYEIFVRLIFEVACFYTGYIVLKIVTFGKFPKNSKEAWARDTFLSGVGVSFWLVIMLFWIFLS